MKQKATDVVAVLAIIAGTAASVVTTGTLMLSSRADDVPEVASVVYLGQGYQDATQVIVKGDRLRFAEPLRILVRARCSEDGSPLLEFIGDAHDVGDELLLQARARLEASGWAANCD